MVLTREKFTTFIEKLCGEDYIIGMHGIDQYRLTDGKKSIAQQVEEMQRIMEIISNFENGINPNLDDVTKAKYAYDYMQQIRYRGKGQDGETGNVTRSKHFDGLTNLIIGKSTCQGFAHTYKELLTRMGIECTEISGSLGGTGQHI